MRLDILTDDRAAEPARYRILCGEEAAGSLTWDGRGGFALDALGRSVRLRQPDVLERARQLGQGSRALLAEGFLSGSVSTRRERDGLLGSCTLYELELGDGSARGYPNPGGGRGWRMSVHRDGEQIALAKRASAPVHTPDGFSVVAVDEDAALCGLLLTCYDVYASYLDSDGGAASPFSFRFVNIFGTRAQKLDDPGFEARCEGEQSEEGEDGPEAPVAESSTDRAARLASRFAVKGDIIDRRS